jgi:glucose/arabinose dehydrogenase/azurin
MMRALLHRRGAALALFLALAPARLHAQVVQGKEPNLGGEVDLATSDPAIALQRLKPAEGYEVNLFASERDFPALVKPVALAWDGRGRLWVSTMPSYPHYLPGTQPRDKLLILEDTNGDGRADKFTTFADSLYIPVGFELGDGGVYVSQPPNLVFLKDTNGDDVADERRIILHGFGTEDSHHAIHAFTWGPDGGLYFQEGTFVHSQVETPYGPVRMYNAGVYRYEPKTERLGVFVTYGFANPWGHTFDRWGQDFVADASNGNNYFALPFTGRLDYPEKHPTMRVFTSVVRPTAGAELVSSRQFPDEAQGTLLVPNNIGFQGIKSHKVATDGSGFVSQETAPLLVSSDINFRPIDLEFGPDGALYLVDWFNPLVGHMQYSLRDPRRDVTHGRIWRVTYKGRPLLTPVDLTKQTTAQLLDLLKSYEDRTRYRVRRELREREDAEVRRELARWIARLSPADSAYEHNLLEGLWAYQARDMVEPKLLGQLLRANDYHARAAATRALRFWLDRVDQPLELLRQQVNDEHPLVRLEAVVALSYIQTPAAAEIALEALKRPMDYYLEYGLKETMTGLERQWKPAFTSGQPFAADNPAAVLYLLDRLTPAEVAGVMRTETVNQALLVRPGVALEVRRQALQALATTHRATTAAELLRALTPLRENAELGALGTDLAALLAELPAAEIPSVRADVERIATGARDPRLRQSAYVALMRADGGIDSPWRLAAATNGGLVDLLGGAPSLRDPALQEALFLRVRDLLPSLLSGATTSSVAPVFGRYVRIEQPGNGRTLSLAEVEVLDGPVNLAATGRAEQKSTASNGEARRAIDGNTAGLFREGSVSQSSPRENDPWWEVDLGESQPVSAIRVWKRSDEAAGAELGAFRVRVLDSERHPVFERDQTDTGARPIVFTLGTEQLLRRAAVRALVALPGHETERAAIFADLLRRGIDGELAVAGLQSALARGAPVGDGAALAEGLLAYARRVPTGDRSGPTFTRALELGRALAANLPAADRQRIVTGFEGLLVKSVRIQTVVAAMKFDLGSFAVEAGREVEIVFTNPDEMPHNVVVTAPGAAERVGRAADAMSTRPDGFQKNFVPEMPEVLFATKLVSPGESVTLRFRAPTEPGSYPYICSFPTHWLTMKGTMTVTARQP